MIVLLWIFVGALFVVWLGIVAVGSPYVPTLQKDLDVLFDNLKLKKGDHLVDLGSGDGKVLLMAAKAGASASGVELNPLLALIAKWRLRRYKQAKVLLGNMWKYELPHDMTHLFIFLNGSFIPRLEKRLAALSKNRHYYVISYGFELTTRKPEKVIGAFNLYRF